MNKININDKLLEIDDNTFNIILKPHQKALVYKSLQIDNTFKNQKFRYGMFSDPPGSGKTFAILTLIYFIKIFESHKKNCFLIVVPHNIYTQWIESINLIYKNNMRCLFIKENKNINDIYSNKPILEYNDIILITPLLYSSLVQASIFKNFSFRCVFFDEIDTIQKLLIYNINAEMIWFISASIKTIFKNQSSIVNIGSYELCLTTLQNNDCSCDVKYIKKCMNLKAPEYKKYICKNFYIDDLFSKFLQKKVMNDLNAHNYNCLSKECGNVSLESFQDVIKNLYNNSNKLLISKKESIVEIDKHIKFSNNDKNNYIMSKKKLNDEYQELLNITSTIKKLCFNELVCINCFCQIQQMEVENSYKSTVIDYYISPCGNNICFNCIFNIISTDSDHNFENQKIKIDCIECNKPHLKNSLTLMTTEQEKHEYLTWDKKHILQDILDICNKKILLYSSSRKEINNYLENYFYEKNDSYLELNGGNVEDIANIVHNFKNEPNVKLLFINDLSLSNGLNLDFVDNLIIFNYLEPLILDQVIGRVLRYPKIKTLNIFQLLYKNENI